MGEFHVGPWMTAVGDGEIAHRGPLPVRPGAGSAHEKVERRAGDWAIAAASAALWLDGDTIADAGIALSAVGLTTIDADPRRGAAARPGPVRGAVRAGGRDRRPRTASPIPDGRGPVDYKRHLAGVLTKRALRRAAARALHQEA